MKLYICSRVCVAFTNFIITDYLHRSLPLSLTVKTVFQTDSVWEDQYGIKNCYFLATLKDELSRKLNLFKVMLGLKFLDILQKVTGLTADLLHSAELYPNTIWSRQTWSYLVPNGLETNVKLLKQCYSASWLNDMRVEQSISVNFT